MNQDKDILNKSEDPDYSHFTLQDGRKLDCYRRAETEVATSEELAIDLNSIGIKRKPQILSQSDAEQDRLLQLFLENTHNIWAHREQILSDSRLFLTPVPVQSGLAYTGTGGFKRPTLGVYIEWWSRCEQAVQQLDDGRIGLVYHLSGSPLTGGNRCSMVFADGKTEQVSLCPFLPCWSSFMKINQSYTAHKHACEHYTLDHAIDIITQTGIDHWSV